MAVHKECIGEPGNLGNVLKSLLGFGEEFPVDWSHRNGPTYPPSNILKSGNKWILQFALAGWKKEDIKVEVEGAKLTVSGERGNGQSGGSYSDITKGMSVVHRGMTYKPWSMYYALGRHAKVTDVTFVDGLLEINIDIVVPDEEKPRVIEIKDTKQDNENTESVFKVDNKELLCENDNQ